jgi:hypothetical protein
MGCCKQARDLHRFRYVTSGKDKRCAGNPHNSFVGAAPCGRRKVGCGSVRDVRTDDSEIPCFEFKDVGASTQASGLFSALVRVGTKSSDDFHNFVFDLTGFEL